MRTRPSGGAFLGMPGQAVDQPGKGAQRLENIHFAPGSGMAPTALVPQYLVLGARAAKLLRPEAVIAGEAKR